MKRTTLFMLLSLAVPSAVAEDQPDPGVQVDRDPGRQEQIDQIRELIEQLRDRELPLADRQAVEQRLRQLLLNQQIDQLFEVEPEPDAQVWPGGGEILVNGKPVKIEAYVNPLAQRPREEVVALLNDNDFAVRQSAQSHLLADNTIDREAIKAMLTQATTDEQRYRLLHVAEHHVMREIREAEFGEAAARREDNGLFAARQSASVGFSYQPVLAQDNDQTRSPAVIVTSTMPGFPGHALLEPGDMIIAVDGQNFPGYRDRMDVTGWMKNRISLHQSGETIVLTVLRQGKALNISLVCVQGAALMAMYSTNAFDAAFREKPYEDRWAAARQELAATLPEPAVLKPVQ